MMIANTNATRGAYPEELRDILSIEQAEVSRGWLAAWGKLNADGTPLHSLPDLAAELGVGQIRVKDESLRSTLGSFKALGAPIALVRLILREFHTAGFEPHGLLQGRYRENLSEFTVISATDGNHGRALAAAAQDIGCRCVIVLHANVSIEREQAIAAYGAQIIRVGGNYDESVAQSAALAQVNGWTVVSDTSYEGYEEIPRDVMQGYSTIAAEVAEALASEKPVTHVFLQGGVGGLAAGVASYFWESLAGQRPTMIVVEPVQADCLYQSAIVGKPAKATGAVDSVMAGLACGEPSPLAWKFLRPSVDFFMTVTDDQAIASMRRLAEGTRHDLPLVAGESAVAGLAALQQLAQSRILRAQVGLDSNANVLIISTEGATAPKLIEELVGEPVSSIMVRQRAWAATAGSALAGGV